MEESKQVSLDQKVLIFLETEVVRVGKHHIGDDLNPPTTKSTTAVQ